MQNSRVLIVDDEPDMRWVLAGVFRDEGYEVVEAADGQQALAVLDKHDVDVVVSDVRMPNMDGVDLLRRVHVDDPDLPVVLLSAVEDLETAVGAMKLGAFDYLSKPFDTQRLAVTVGRATEQRQLRREVAQLRDRLEQSAVSFGVSDPALELENTIELVADRGSLSVLLLGESGTGKEVVAREIHRRSPFAAGPFVAVDCGALPEPLMESQLFGHRKGSFTGAEQNRAGLFRMADGGTLFLDELGNLPLALQVKLLRALQERVVVPVGGGEPVPFQARLICATNANLLDDIQAGNFRNDLYHRIAEFTVRIPPLRERRPDVDGFALHFLAGANAEMGRHVRGITEPAREELRQHDWPGNLRELRNAVRRAVVVCAGEELDAADFALETGAVAAGADLADDAGLPLAQRVQKAADALEASILRDALTRAGGNKAAAARALQIDYTTLHRKLKKYGMLTVVPAP